MLRRGEERRGRPHLDGLAQLGLGPLRLLAAGGEHLAEPEVIAVIFGVSRHRLGRQLDRTLHIADI